jgi:hypothetical protein
LGETGNSLTGSWKIFIGVHEKKYNASLIPT